MTAQPGKSHKTHGQPTVKFCIKSLLTEKVGIKTLPMTINDLSLVVIILNRRRFPGSDRITNKQIFGDGGGGESTYIHCLAFECNHFTWENTPDMETRTHSSFAYKRLQVFQHFYL